MSATIRMGLLGKKVSVGQLFDPQGIRVPYTALQVGPCVILHVKTENTDGYSAVTLGFDERKPKRVPAPMMGLFNKVKTRPRRFVREIRIDEGGAASFKVGEEIGVSRFKAGQFVDVTGVSKGKGFQGVMKRHNFAGFPGSHGTHEYFRHAGAIGCRSYPGKVFKGSKMAGQMGNARVTTQNLRVVRVIPEDNLLLVIGSVPGAVDGYVLVRDSLKRPAPAAGASEKQG